MKIKHYIDASVNGCGCNLECSYCYLRQKNYNKPINKSVVGYPIRVIKKACSIERLGGRCLFAIVGDGETLLPDDIIDLIVALIEEGHFVTVITNGTITKRFHELVERLEKIGRKEAVCIHFSLHYQELKNKNLLTLFFNNVAYIRSNNMSYHIKTILGEEYDENLANELKTVCLKEVGAYPQVGIARKDNPSGSFSICTNMSKKKYFELGDSFDSKLFELDKKEFNRKRAEFCYAGKWVFDLNFSTGMCWECLSNASNRFNFFEHINDKLPLEAVGACCNRKYCSCVNLQAWGIMPEHEEFSNLDIYDRPEAGWIKEPFQSILDTKLYETNRLYNEEEKEKLEKRKKRKEKKRQFGKICMEKKRQFEEILGVGVDYFMHRRSNK